MKTVLIASIALGCLASSASAQVLGQAWTSPATEEEKDYGTGRIVSQCVMANCQIFTAQLLTDSPKSGEPVEVKMVEGLWRIGSEAGTLKLPYATPTFRKYPLDLALAWTSVAFSKGALATVILARERIRGVQAGDPWYVTTNDHASATIRLMVAEATRSMAPSYSVSDAVDSLSRESNPALAGFLYEYLDVTDRHHPEVASPLFAKLLASTSVPDIERKMVVSQIIVSYYRLPKADRMGAVGRLAEIAQNSNAYAAVAALDGLGHIARFDNAVWTYLSPAALGKTAAAYRNLRGKNLIAKTESLENGLAVR